MSYKTLVNSKIKSLNESDNVFSLANNVIENIQRNSTHFAELPTDLFTSLKTETNELEKAIKNVENEIQKKAKAKKNLQSGKVLHLLYLHAKHISKLSKTNPDLILLSGFGNSNNLKDLRNQNLTYC